MVNPNAALSSVPWGQRSRSNSVEAAQASALGRKSVVLCIRNIDPCDSAFISV